VELAAACGWPSDVLQNARSVESHVETLCPDHELCEVDSLGEGFNAYKLLGLTRQNLKGIIADNQIQSFDTMRTALVNLQQSVVPGSDTDMFDAMNRVLFNDWPQRRSTESRSDHKENDPPPDHQENQENELSVPGHQLSSPEDVGVAPLDLSQLDDTETQEGNIAMTSDAFAGSMEDTVKSESGTSSLSTSSSESDSSDDSSTSSSDESLSSADKKD
jgi:hypothetical protein